MRNEAVFTLVMLCSTLSYAHSDHAPKAARCAKECTQEQIEAAVPEAVTMLTKMGKVDASWATAKIEKIEQKQFKKGPEWVATLLDEKQKDAKKQRLYAWLVGFWRVSTLVFQFDKFVSNPTDIFVSGAAGELNFDVGISQGLTWSTTVIMKIDLVGSQRRGLAMGLNEFAGYLAVAASALATGFIASHWGLRPQPFYLGFAYVAIGLLLSAFFVKETAGHVAREVADHGKLESPLTQKEIFMRTTLKDRTLSSVVQAGFINNLNDGMAWGLFPILFTVSGLSLSEVGWLAALYPATWGILQLWTGHLSDSIGRKWLIASGMWVQAAGIGTTAVSDGAKGFAVGAVLLGVGTAMV